MITGLLFPFLKAMWELTAQMAPYLILGFAIGGILHALVPTRIISRFMGGENLSCVTKATLIGIPLPLCSCGVLPVAASARQSGAARAPSLSFLITTPVTGVDSILATLALLGPIFTGFRIAASFVLGMAAGILSIVIPGDHQKPETEYCESCEKNKEAATLLGKAKDAFLYGLVELPRSLAGSVLLGIAIGGLITAAMPAEFISQYIGAGIIGILAAVAIGIPLYVCATGSIPIAAAMVMKGFSPGAALAFLIAGPATNAVAFTTVKKILGTRSLVIYLFTVFAGAIAAGLTLNWLWPASFNMAAAMHAHSAKTLSPFYIVSGVLLLLLLGYYKINSWVADIRCRGGKAMAEQGFKIILSVSNMSCEHCKESIIKNLAGIENVKAVGVNLKKKKVTVSLLKDTDADTLINSLAKDGFKAQLIEKAVPSK